MVALIALHLTACGTVIVDPGDHRQVQAWSLDAAQRRQAAERILAEFADLASVETRQDRVRFVFLGADGELRWGCGRVADRELFYPSIRLQSRGLASLSPRRLWQVTRFAARLSRRLNDHLDEIVPSEAASPESCGP